MALALVAYDLTDSKLAQWQRFVARCSTDYPQVVVVENHPTAPKPTHWPADATWTYVRGSNRHYEFSGYMEALACLVGGETFSALGYPLYAELTLENKDSSTQSGKIPPEEPIYLFNDTLFSHHSLKNWARIVKETNWQPGIYGDLREEPIQLDHRVLRIFATWHFALIGSEARQQCMASLAAVLAQFEEPLEEASYQRYLQHYLAGNWLRGYTDPRGIADPDALLRKKHCIYAEHRLGRLLDDQGYWRPHPSPHYPLTRKVDRILALRRRILKRLTL